jgi:hypothetical protein
MEKKDFFTRQRANEGIKLPLVHPTTGAVTEHWLRIRGRDSDVFRRAETESRRRLVDLVKEAESNDKETVAKQLEAAEEGEMRKLVSALVMDWSFPDPCTPENVSEFLQEAPHIQDAIDKAAVRRSLFFAGVSSNSPDTPKPNSDSISDQKAQSNP